MKKIKNKRLFGVALIFVATAVASLVGWFLGGRENRFLVAFIIAFAYALFNFYGSFSKKGVVEELEESLDERDVYIALKTSKMAMHIFNFMLSAACMVCLVLYATIRVKILMVSAVTILIVKFMLFFLVLFLSNHYEKYN